MPNTAEQTKLLKVYADQTARYAEPNQTAGVKAGLSNRNHGIPRTMLNLILSGLTPVAADQTPKSGEFAEWTGPVKVVKGPATVPAETILSNLSDARTRRASGDFSDAINDAFDARIAELLSVMRGRKIADPETGEVPPTE